MRITKWVDFGADIPVDISIDDIRGALGEAFAEVTNDRLAEEGPSRADVAMAFSSIGSFLRALTDDQIALLLPAQRKIIAAFLAEQAERFNGGSREQS